MKTWKLLLALPIIFCLSFAGSIQQYQAQIIKMKKASAGTNWVEDANCMGAWFMNGAFEGDGSEDETDRSGENETLSAVGGNIIDSATVPGGYSGRSRDFEKDETEVLNHIDGGSTDISGADQHITVACWIKPEDDMGSSMYIVSKWQSAADKRQYALGYSDGSSGFMGLLRNPADDANAVAIGNTDIAYGSWQHIAMVYNDTDIRIYLNGVLDTKVDTNPLVYADGILAGSGLFNLGGTSSSSDPYDGLIDEPIVLDKALSAANILEMYTKGISGDKGASD